MGRFRKQQVQRKASHSPATAEHSGSTRAQPDVSVTLGASPAQRKQQENISAMQHSPAAIAQREKADLLSGAVTQCAEEELLQGKAIESIQRAEDEELLQGKMDESIQRVDDEELMQGKAKDSAQLKEQPSNDTGLPDNLKTGIESMSGMSMDNVKVHYNSDKPAQLNAHAYAQGTDIHVGPGQEQHLPHEAWHVVQQAEGRVKPTMEVEGGAKVNDDPSLESEADAMGAKATQMNAKNDNKSADSN